MAKKELVSRSYQKRLIFIVAIVLVLQLIGSLVFLAQNDFLRFASSGILDSTIAAIVLPILLVVLAYFAIDKKVSRLWRTTQSVVWASAGMLLMSLMTVGWYVVRFNDDNTVLTYLYGPATTTIILYIVALAIFTRKGHKAKDAIGSKAFQELFIGVAAIYLLIEIIFMAISIYKYWETLDYGWYTVDTFVPILLAIVLISVGYKYLRLIKSKLARLFYVVLGLCIATYVGNGLNIFANYLYGTGSLQIVLSAGAQVLVVVFYVLWIRVLKKQLIPRR